MKTGFVFRHVLFEDFDSLGESLLEKGYRWQHIDTPFIASQCLAHWPTIYLSFWTGR
ncbi:MULTISPECIES: hypothetical protein [Phytobacter]|jgi:hypothetical protein|uniref:Uncharacterized protein n=1 Tax=Citrobacter bitternis TaxID=1585982 RepID=A0ABW1Q268_9ENTR|nr:hypothetical protein [Phytobacter sp. SCO41]